MATVVSLRLQTSESNHDEALKMFPDTRIDKSWRDGDEDFRGKPVTSSGANIFIIEKDSWEDAIASSVKAITALPKVFKKLAALGVEGELDFGIDSAPDAFERSATFAPDALAVFSNANLSVRVSFYSVDDEEE